MTTLIRRLTLSILLCVVLLMLFLIPRYVFAANAVVGDGSPASCTESAFDSALGTVQTTGGGVITFNCGATPLSITISGYKTISTTVTVDGGDLITFDGNHTSPFFLVSGGAILTVEHIGFTNGIDNGIAPLTNFGTMTLNDVAVVNSAAGGSAVVNQGGATLLVRDSTFMDNVLPESVNESGAALTNSGGTTRIEASVFANNVTTGTNGGGSAVFNFLGTVEISTTQFTNNIATYGGAIYAAGPTTTTTTIHDSHFTANHASYGGAINAQTTSFTITESVFEQNNATAGDGGAIFMNGGDVDVDTSQFMDNHASALGGGISCYSGNLTVSNSTLADNEAESPGGAIFSLCAVSMTNATLTGNRAAGGGGGIYQAGGAAAVLEYVTIVDNTAPFGAGIYNEVAGASTLTIGKSIVAYNSTGNCDGEIVSGGYNLTNDTGCSVFTQTGDVSNANLPLSALGDYGGPTFTRLPLPDNAALEHIPNSVCGLSADQRGVPRPQGTDCDSGAVELAASDPLPPTATPTVTPAATPSATPTPTLTEKLFLPLTQK